MEKENTNSKTQVAEVGVLGGVAYGGGLVEHDVDRFERVLRRIGRDTHL